MARTKKRLKIIIMGHRDSLSYLIFSWQSLIILGFIPGDNQHFLGGFDQIVHKTLPGGKG